jgi:hypothetical protein
MPELIPPLPHLLVGREEAIHRALGAEVPPLVEQRRIDFRGSQVHKARLVQHAEDRDAFRVAERAG